MDFSFTEDQLALKDYIIKFAKKELNEGAIEREEKEEFSWENWRKCADFGAP